MTIETISVIGLGYIGLPTAAAFASQKIKVIGVDVNEKTVDTINQGKTHIVEPDLDIAVQSAVATGYLRATVTPEPADAFLIAVPTPFKGNHEPDLKYIEAACKSIAPVLKSGDLVILESTSPVGTTEQMSKWMAEMRQDLTFPQTHDDESDIRVAYCPERVLPGHVMRELIENDRVIGGLTEKCSLASIELYKVFVQGECVVTNSRTAEMAKLTENSFRDVNIAFANELSMIADKLDINVWELIRLANRHPRVNILQPGPGVGGHCIAVDPWFIVSKAPEQSRLIRMARRVNDYKSEYVVKIIKKAAKQYPKPTIACFGLSFKANIDDLRESPAIAIAQAIINSYQGRVLLVEPNIDAMPEVFMEEPDVYLVGTDYAVKEAEIIIGLVKHQEFEKINKIDLKQKTLIDTCNIWGENS